MNQKIKLFNFENLKYYKDMHLTVAPSLINGAGSFV